jgi:predicted DNA binding CopG/RHH family protein
MKNKTTYPPKDSIFKNHQQEAQFWHEHFAQAQKDGKPVTVKFAKKIEHIYLNDSINIRLDSQTSTAIRKAAQKKGLGPTQLIRMWIMEKMNQSSNQANL